MTQKLYRPYLTLPELSLICDLLSTNLSSPEATTAYGKLFKLKIEAEIGLRKEAYQKKPSILEKLEDTSPEQLIRPSAELWEIFNSNPSSLSLAQIRAAKTYGWEQGLMSAVEKAVFEWEQGL